MNFFDVIALLGGIAMFLYGMTMMGNGLEKLASGKAESVLQKMTSSPIRGVLLGTLITGLIQSSAGTTVVVIGLVNSGIMQFVQGMGVVMGANIGTTVTAQLISLTDISGDNIFLKLLQPSTLAPVAAVVGIVFFMFLKGVRRHNIGQVLLGFGVLFTGIFTMEAAVYPLRESPLFIQLFSGLQNPFLGLLAGIIVTALLQSSSASVGILQALTVTGAVTWGSAIPIILGQNIGTTTTGLIASSGASRAAKRIAGFHVIFNVLGTAVYFVVIYSIKGIFGLPFWDDAINKTDIAMFHTFFNVSCTLLFLPFMKGMAWLSEKLVPEKPGDHHPELEPVILDMRLLATPSMAISQVRKAVEQMAELGHMNQIDSIPLLLQYNAEKVKLTEQREDVVDKLDVNITDYLVDLAELDLSEQESRDVTMMLNFVTEFERMADYAMNVVERAGEVFDKRLRFSDEAQHELAVLSKVVDEIYCMATGAFVDDDRKVAARVEPLEETVDLMCETLRERHIARLREGHCTLESGIVFLEVLNDYERISDHCSNVAARLLSSERGVADPHALRRSLHAGQDAEYNEMARQYRDRYMKELDNYSGGDEDEHQQLVFN